MGTGFYFLMSIRWGAIFEARAIEANGGERYLDKSHSRGDEHGSGGAGGGGERHRGDEAEFHGVERRSTRGGGRALPGGDIIGGRGGGPIVQSDMGERGEDFGCRRSSIYYEFLPVPVVAQTSARIRT